MNHSWFKTINWLNFKFRDLIEEKTYVSKWKSQSSQLKFSKLPSYPES